MEGGNSDLNGMKISYQTLQYANRSVVKDLLSVWEKES